MATNEELHRFLAQQLMGQPDLQPVGVHFSPWQGAANAGNKMLGALMAKRAGEAAQTRQTGIQRTIAQALGGPQLPADGVGPAEDPNEFLIKTLAGNEDTAPMALDFQMKQRMKKMDNDADLALAVQKKNMGVGNGVDPYWTTVSTVNGLYKFNARTGEMVPLEAGGKPLLAPAASPDLAHDKAKSTATGKAEGEAAGGASAGLPDLEQKTTYAKGVIDQLVNHPGRAMLTGASGYMPVIRGTDTAGAKALHDQITGQAFLQAFESLRGGGQITQIEGEKATAAIARLNTAQKDEEYVAALKELQTVMDAVVQRQRAKAGKAPALLTSPDAEAGIVDFGSLK